MRGSGGAVAVPLAAAGLWLAAVAMPTVAASVGALGAAEHVDGLPPMRPMSTLLGVTIGYAALVSVLAALVGWAPGRVLGAVLCGAGSRPGRAMVVATLALAPICVPAYLVFYTWWQAWPADSVIYGWAVRHQAVTTLRVVTLVIGLAAWSWPIVAWTVAVGRAEGAAHRAELRRIDGAGICSRLGGALREDGRGLVIGAAIAFLLAFGNTTCFDLAQVFTFGNELRALAATGADPAHTLRVAGPALLVVAAGAVIGWSVLARRRSTVAELDAHVGPVAGALSAVVWIATLAVPFVLLLGRVVRDPAIGEFVRLYGASLAKTLGQAILAGLSAGVVTLGLAQLWHGRSVWARGAAHVQAVGWALTALVPGTIVAVGLELAYNRAPHLADLVYRERPILLLAHLARFGVVAALLGWWCAAREPRSLEGLRRIDGDAGIRGLWRAAGPRLVAASGAAVALVTVLAFGEITVTARIHPPGTDPLAPALLDAMHYQRPDTVISAAVIMLALALAAAGVVAVGLLARSRRGPARLVTLGLCATLVAGCADPDEPAPLRVDAIFGSTGTALGQFSYPRCIALDATRGHVFVVDKTARVQRFGLDGVPQLEWSMPAREQGKPTGVSVSPDGRVFVADTHYYRIIAYSPEGEELLRFGRYGTGDGEFIYPTDVAFGPESRLYVAEYGGNDRIQVFSPTGDYLFQFGRFGSETGAFSRPQSIIFNPAGTELFVADSCNHRIVVTDPQGNVLRVFGRAGRGPGELHYPYGLAFDRDGSLIVAEFGNNRIQRFAPAGTPAGLFGRLGTAEGELRYPWGVASADRMVFVLDSGNNRVQRVRRLR